MQAATRITMRIAPRVANRSCALRYLHASPAAAANVASIVGTGPPPEAPVPDRAVLHERVARRRKQAEMLKTAKDIRNAKDGSKTGFSQRFWKDVSVKEVDGVLQVFLDARPLRHPSTKEVVRIPISKPTLATAIALEWDLLTSSQQATKEHLIPLTSLVCRAIDIAKDDASSVAEADKIRTLVTTQVLRYLDTDSLLCWAPPAGKFDLRNDAGESLRDVQKQVAEETIAFLTTHTWPGVKIVPVLDGDSIMPRAQEAGVREIVQGWIMGLDAWELAGLERAVLAGKSLLAAARFVVDWSEGPVGVPAPKSARFGVEEAALATSLEVDWQTSQWGEVDDTHDVHKEDVRRQLGSVVLLVSGDAKQEK